MMIPLVRLKVDEVVVLVDEAAEEEGVGEEVAVVVGGEGKEGGIIIGIENVRLRKGRSRLWGRRMERKIRAGWSLIRLVG